MAPSLAVTCMAEVARKGGAALLCEIARHRLVAKPGCGEIGFRHTSFNMYIYTINEARKHYILLDTILNYMFYFGPPGKPDKNQENLLHVGHVVGFGDSRIDGFLEVQNQRYS
jgi:hypothetical protein